MHSIVGFDQPEVVVEGNGLRFDAWTGETDARVACAVHGRRIEWVDGEGWYVPLAMAPFHALFPIGRVKYTEISVVVRLSGAASARLLVRRYYLDRARTCHRTVPMPPLDETVEAGTYQCQWGEDVDVPAGTTEAEIRLNTNHPMHTVYFWGFEHDDAFRKARVRLSVSYPWGTSADGESRRAQIPGLHDLVDSSVADLEYLAKARGVFCPGVVIVPISVQPFFGRDMSTVNASRLDRLFVRVSLAEPTTQTVRVRAGCINLQPFVTRDGFVGLKYSK